MVVALAQAPQAMPVVYEHLSQRVLEAEGQKDILFQVLRERFGAMASFEELDVGVAAARALVVRCQKCGAAGGVYEKGSLERLGGGDLAFRVLGSSGSQETWRISVGEMPVWYVAMATRDLRAGESFQAEDAVVRPCLSEATCSGNGAFPTRDDAMSGMSAWTGLRVTRPVRSGTALAAPFFAQEMVVRANDTVKVVVAPSSEVVIRTVGRALGSAPRGGRLRVEVEPFSRQTGNSGRKIIDAVVTAPGEVTYVR